MLPNPENGVFSPSTSSPSISNPPPPKPHQIDRNNNLQENRAPIDILETELLYDESLSQIIKKQEEVVTISDACSTNCTVFALDYERKIIRSPSIDEEEEDVNETGEVSDVSKCRRIDEAEGNKNEETKHGLNETGEDYGNQESELDEIQEDINQENNNGEEVQQEKDEHEEETEKEEEKTEELDEEEGEKHEREEHIENVGAEHSDNHQNSEQNDSGKQESEQNEDETEVKETEEEERKAADKGKRPISEICELKFIVPKFSKFEQGPSDTPELFDNELNNDYYDNDDHQDLAILKSIWHFKCNNGYFPYPHTDELHNHIMDSIPNLKILGEDLTKKIVALESKFNAVRELDGNNPDMARPIDREIFDLSMRLWGNNSEDNIGDGAVDEQLNQEIYGVNILNSSTAYDDEDWSWI